MTSSSGAEDPLPASDDAKGRGTPTQWLVIDVQIDEGQLRDHVVMELFDAGATAVEELPEGVRTAFPDTGDGRRKRDEALEVLGQLLGDSGGIAGPVAERIVPHEVWEESWRHGLGPRQVSERILVRPTWSDPVPLSEGVHELVLDPGVAFGTAEHATTRGALRLLDALCRPGQKLLDLGSGSAILSIAAALLGARTVVAVDFDPFATGAALENIARNGVGEVVTVKEAMLTPSGVVALGPVDGIMANIQSGILTELLPGIAEALRPGGWVILSGILRIEASRMQARAEQAGLSLEAEDGEDEWWSAVFRKSMEPSSR